jgi:hypothetical protein
MDILRRGWHVPVHLYGWHGNFFQPLVCLYCSMNEKSTHTATAGFRSCDFSHDKAPFWMLGQIPTRSLTRYIRLYRYDCA